MLEPLTAREAGLIQSQPVCRVATLNKDQTIHIVSVCPAVVDNTVYIDLQVAKQTGRNLERDPRATVLFDEYSSDWTKLWGVQLRCSTAFVEPGSEEWERAWAAMTVRYPQYAAFEWTPKRIVRLVPDRKVSWGGPK